MTLPLWNASRYLELCPQEVGREVCVAEKAIRSYAKTYPVLHYVYSGSGRFEYQGKTYILHPGDCFYIAQGEEASYAPLEEDPWSYFWVGLGGSRAQSLLESVGLSSANPVRHDYGKSWKRHFEDIYESHFVTGEFGLDSLGHCYLLINALGKGRDDAFPAHEKGHIQAAKSFIRNNFQFPISVDDIAKSVGVTPNYLANLFQAQGEPTPKSYLTEIRMEAASKLLLESHHPIGDVAKAVGYKNPLHFSKIFKEFYGVSPQKYRNQGGIGK